MSKSPSVKRQTPVAKASSLAVLALASFLSPNIGALTAAPSFAQLAASPASPAKPLADFDNAYVLGAGDQIQINMYGQENLFSTPYNVLIDGTISLPFIGRVNVGGSTISQAQAAIAQRYTQFFKRPYVTVVLLEPRDIKVNIAGEVLKPGPYPIPPEESNPTVASVIKLAGGHTQSADLRKVEVRRPRKDGTQEVLVSDVLRLIQDGDGSQNVLLRDGDTVVVRTSEQPDLAAAGILGQNSLTPDRSEPLNVAVVGEVYRPGPYVISSSNAVIQEAGEVGSQQGGVVSGSQPTISQAIQRAGGIKPEANIRKIQVKRATRFGTEQVIEVDLWKLLQEGDLQQDIALQNRDTVIIPTSDITNQAERIAITDSTLSPATISVNIVGEVRQPGAVQISPNTPLTQAVLSAGGFDSRRANKKSVDLIRMSPDGTVSQRRITLAYNGKADEETNPVLKDNDVVVVRRSGLAKFGDGAASAFAPFSGIFTFLRLLPGI